MNRALLGLLIVAGCGSDSSEPPPADQTVFYDITLSFNGFTGNAGSRIIARIVQDSGTPVEGNNKVSGLMDNTGNLVLPMGQVKFKVGYSYSVQYYADANLNCQWDGPVGPGEQSWVAPIGVVTESVTYLFIHNTNFQAMPSDINGFC